MLRLEAPIESTLPQEETAPPPVAAATQVPVETSRPSNERPRSEAVFHTPPPHAPVVVVWLATLVGTMVAAFIGGIRLGRRGKRAIESRARTWSH